MSRLSADPAGVLPLVSSLFSSIFFPAVDSAFLCYTVIMSIEELQKKLHLYAESHPPKPVRRSAVLVPLLYRGEEPELLFEQRSFLLEHQPGEVCFPGGRVEGDETPEEAALREICEELLVTPEQVRILAPLNAFYSSTDQNISAFVCRLEGYQGTFSEDEVEKVFTIPLNWFLEHEPDRYETVRTVIPGEDFPYELIPGGKNYPWKKITHIVPVYPDTDPVIWGLTARITDALCRALKTG